MSTPSWQRLPAADPRAAFNLRRWGFLLGGGLVALGLVILSVAGGGVLRRATRGAHRLTFPGSRTVHLSPGLYLGVPTKALPEGQILSFNVTVQEALTGLPVPVQLVPGGPGPRPRPLFSCEILDAADFLITGVLDEGGPPKVELVLVHESLSANLSDLVVGGIAALLLAGGGSYIIWAVHRKTRSAPGTFPAPSR